MKCRFRLFAGMLVLGAFIVVGCDSETSAPSQEQVNTSEKAEDNAVQATKAAEAVQNVDKTATQQAVRVADQLATTGSLCTLVGKAGDTASCSVKLAAGANGAVARALQGTLSYDASGAKFNGFFDEFCPSAGNCVEKEINASSPALSATGHTLSMSPKASAEWNGKGSFLLANLTNPTQALTEARVGSDAANQGIFTAKFTLARDASASSPVVVDLSGVVAADEAANEIRTSVANSTIVTGEAIQR
jgi:hypothetical protein